VSTGGQYCTQPALLQTDVVPLIRLEEIDGLPVRVDENLADPRVSDGDCGAIAGAGSVATGMASN
jgi:hypothetical protein